MLSVHFTGDDLGRIRIRAAHPVWETVLSLRALRDRSRRPVLGDWRARTGALLPASSRILLELCPSAGSFAEFLLPRPDAQRWDQGITHILATPAEQIMRDLAGLSWTSGAPGWACALASRDEQALNALGRALGDYHRVGVAPYWEQIQALVDVERSFRLRVIGEGGVERLLSTLATAVRWRSGTLELFHHGHRDVRLDGRGIILAPSVFCGRHSVIKEFAGAPPVLFFPAATDPDRPLAVPGDHPGAPGHRTDALSALMGPTRAAALQEVIGGTTTSELARRLGIAPSTASEHTRVLRDAGLITTGRRGRQVVHAITPLGAALFRHK